MKFNYLMRKYLSIFSITILLFASFPNMSLASEANVDDYEEDIEAISEVIEEESGRVADQEESTSVSELESKGQKDQSETNTDSDLVEDEATEEELIEQKEQATVEVEKNEAQVKKATKEVKEKEGLESTKKAATDELSALVDQSIQKTVDYYKNNLPTYNAKNKGSHSDYWVFSALWSAGVKDLKNDLSWPENSNPWMDSTYWSEGKNEVSGMANEEIGIIIGSTLLGLDPYQFGEHNIVEDLLDRQQDNGMFSTIWGEAWALIALDLIGADYDKEQQIDSMLKAQNDQGLFGDTDATGWTLLALAPYMDRPEVKAAIEQSVSYIHKEFMENDIYPGMFGPNANTTSSVIMGLAAVGEDLYSDKWTKNSGSLIEDLLEYQQSDGSFWWQKDEPGAVNMATEQALLSLATVQAGESTFEQMKKELTIPEDSPENIDQTIDISTAIDDVTAYIIEEGVTSEWEAVGLYQAGIEVPTSYQTYFDEKVQLEIVNGLENGRFKITDAERLALAALAIEQDPQQIDEINLIELIYNSPMREMWDGTTEDTMTFQGNNGLAFALIALDAANFEVPEDAKWNREKIVKELLNKQLEDGSWSLNDAYPSPSIDITAMVMTALAPYTEDEAVQQAADRAVTFLSDVQTNEGGFDGGDFVGGITSEAASQVIIGLTANNIDPTEERFTKSENIIEHLLSFQHEDGGFLHTLDNSSSNGMATEQALQALVAYEMFVRGEGPLYQFNQDSEEPKDDEEDTNEETEEEDTNEETEEEDTNEETEEEDTNEETEEEDNNDKTDENSQGKEDDDRKIDEDSDSNTETEVTVEESKADQDEVNNELPNTATNYYQLFMIGFTLFVLGLAFALLRRRNMNN